MAGSSILGKFRTQLMAEKSLADDLDFYNYWAGSASVSVDNTEAEVVKC